MSEKVDLDRTTGSGDLESISAPPSLNEVSSHKSKDAGEIQDAFGDEADGEVHCRFLAQPSYRQRISAYIYKR